MSPKASSRKKWWIRIGIAAIVILTLMILFMTGRAESIKQASNQLNVPKDWTLTTERVEPPRLLCVGDNACPSIHGSWTTPKILSRNDLESIIHNSGFSFPVEGSCVKQRNESGSIPLCSARGQYNGFDMAITLWSIADLPDKSQVTLNVE